MVAACEGGFVVVSADGQDIVLALRPGQSGGMSPVVFERDEEENLSVARPICTGGERGGGLGCQGNSLLCRGYRIGSGYG